MKIKLPLREPRQKGMRFTVPLIPPSVNHYKRPKLNGKGFYVTDEAKAFKAAVAVLSRGSVEADYYFVGVIVFLGHGARGDAGNFEKCIGDGLEDAGIITNDAKVKKYHIEVLRDWNEPRTEIFVCDLAEAPRDDGWIKQTERVERLKESGAPISVVGRKFEPQSQANGPCSLHGAVVCRQCFGL